MKPGGLGPRGIAHQQIVTPTGGVEGAGKIDARDKPVPDVYEKAGQLHFPTSSTPPSEASKAERAKRMLQALRAKTENRKAFGGRVTIGGIDKAGSLGNYYPTLRAAGSLTRQVPEAHGGVQRFIGQVSLPDDLTEWGDKAANLRPIITPEKVKKLGDRSFPDYEAFKKAHGQADPDSLALSDDCIKDVAFNKEGSTHLYFNLTKWFGPKVADNMKEGWLRLYTRAAEIGVATEIQDWDAVLKSVPQSVQMAKLLTRTARALGKNPDEIELGDKKLTEWREEPPAVPKPERFTVPNTPMGTESFTPDAFWKAWAEATTRRSKSTTSRWRRRSAAR